MDEWFAGLLFLIWVVLTVLLHGRVGRVKDKMVWFIQELSVLRRGLMDLREEVDGIRNNTGADR